MVFSTFESESLLYVNFVLIIFNSVYGWISTTSSQSEFCPQHSNADQKSLIIYHLSCQYLVDHE